MSEARLQASGSGLGTATAEGASWIDAELAGCALGDKRLCDRLRWLLHQLEGAMGAPLPLACQDWANTKAAYRFFSNERFGEDAILAGHFQSTASRFAATTGLVLVVQDTTEFSFRGPAGDHRRDWPGVDRAGSQRQSAHVHAMRAVDAQQLRGDDRGPSVMGRRMSIPTDRLAAGFALPSVVGARAATPSW